MKLYLGYMAMHVKSQMEYRSSLFMRTLSQFLVAFSAFWALQFLFMRFDNVGGFTQFEVMLTFAIMVMAFSLGELVGRGFDYFPILVSDGGFDRALVRPRNVAFQVLASQMHLHRLGRLLQAVVVLVYVLPRGDIIWNMANVGVLLLMIICGAVLFFCLFVLCAAVSFFIPTAEGMEFINVLTNGGVEHGRLPFGVYGDGILKFLTYVVPLALVQYYPLLYITGRSDRLVDALAPLFATLFLIPCVGFFRFGMRRYKSIGS